MQLVRMGRKGQNSNTDLSGTQDLWVHCPECNVRLKQKNLNRHLTSIHPDLTPKERKRSIKAVRTEIGEDDEGLAKLQERARFFEEVKAYTVLGVIIAAILIGYFIIDATFLDPASNEAPGMGQSDKTQTPSPIQEMPDNPTQPDPNREDPDGTDPSDDQNAQTNYQIGTGSDNWWIPYPSGHPSAGAAVSHHPEVEAAVASKPVLIIIHSDCAACAQQYANADAVAKQYSDELAYIDCNIYDSEANYELAVDLFGIYDPTPSQSYVPLTIIASETTDSSGEPRIIWHASEGETGKTWIEDHVQDAIVYYEG